MERTARTLTRAALGAALFLPAVGHAQLWKCTDADGGTTYTNDTRLTRGRACQLLLPATPRPKAPAPAGDPRVPRPPLATSPSAPTAPPRDTLRRQILTAELETEAAQIAALEAQLSSASTTERSQIEARLARHRRNLEAIRRELARLP